MAIRPYADIGYEAVTAEGVQGERPSGVVQVGTEFEIAEVFWSTPLIIDPYLHLSGGGAGAASSVGLGCRAGPAWRFGAQDRWRFLPFFETRIGQGLGQTQVNGFPGWHEEGGQYLAGLGCAFDYTIPSGLALRLGGYALGGPAKAQVEPFQAPHEYQASALGLFAGLSLNLNAGRGGSLENIGHNPVPAII